MELRCFTSTRFPRIRMGHVSVHGLVENEENEEAQSHGAQMFWPHAWRCCTATRDGHLPLRHPLFYALRCARLPPLHLSRPTSDRRGRQALMPAETPWRTIANDDRRLRRASLS